MKLRDLRIQRKLTLRELSEQMGVTLAYISQLEKSPKTPSLRIAFKLANFFGNSKFKTLIGKYSKMDVVLAVDYIANAYPHLWKAANQKKKMSTSVVK